MSQEPITFDSLLTYLTKKVFRKLQPKKTNTPEGKVLTFSPITVEDFGDFFQAMSGHLLTDFIPADFTSLLNSLEITSEAAIQKTDPTKGLSLLMNKDGGFGLSFAVEWTSPWTIENVLTISNSFVAFTINKPPNNGKLSVSAVLSSGDLVFNKAQLDLQLTTHIPSFLTVAELTSVPKDGGQSHKEIAKKYLGTLSKNSNALEVEDIRLTAAPFLSNYSLHLAVDNVLDIHDKITVRKFQSDIDYRGGIAGGYSIFAYTDLLLGFEQNPIDITLSAKRAKDDTSSSWLFSGSLAHPITVAETLKDITQLFDVGNYEVPDLIGDILIERLQFSFEVDNSLGAKSKETKYAFLLEIKPIKGHDLDVTLTVDLTKDKPATATASANGRSTIAEPKPGGYYMEITGLAQMGPYEFEVDLSQKKDGAGRKQSLLVADFSDKEPISLKEIVTGLSSDQTINEIIPDIRLTIADAMFLLLKESPQAGQAAKSKYLIGLTLGLALDFSDLPLVGKLFGKGEGINDIRILYASQGLNLSEIEAINASKGVKTKLPESTGQGADTTTPSTTNPGDNTAIIVNKGLMVSADTNLPGVGSKPLALPLGNRPSTEESISAKSPYKKSAQTAGSSASTLPSAPNITWFEIGASLGPFTLQRIGGAYKKGGLELLMTSSFKLGILNFTLDGLGIKMNPFPPKSSDAGTILKSISPELLGMEADLQKGPLTISGGFLKDGKDYYGEVSITAGPLSFMAIGGYSDTEPPSFFIYVSLQAPLGGPPFFFVTGLAGGFGINRGLVLPTMETVTTYPLMPQNAPPQGSSPASTMTAVIPQLKQIFKNEPGQYWIAAGIQFTSFEMVDAFVLVTISFGVDFQLGLLGQATMSFPKYDPVPLAYVQLDLVASVTPSTGLLSVEARLAPNCYVLDPLVRISGGFAFLAWFGGPHKGDFVISLGGYHPAFKKPAYYPMVPRLQLKYGIGPFAITGKLYFALVPSMMMAGMEMSATWSSGPVSLWFKAGIDFLLGWAPFHYLGDAYIRVGASVDLGLFSISVHVGADILIWGPKFGGKAEIDLDVTSVTIHFGADKNPPPPVGWDKFKQKFLPKSEDKAELQVVKGSVGKGLKDQDKDGIDWIIDPNHFQIALSSAVPIGTAQVNEKAVSAKKSDYNQVATDGSFHLALDPTQSTNSDDQIWQNVLNVGPMDKTNIQSAARIRLQRRNSQGTWEDFHEITIQPVIGGSPQALWGPYRDASEKNPNSPAKQLIPHTFQGIQLSPIPRIPDKLSKIPLVDLLFQQDHTSYFKYTTAAVNTTNPIQSSTTGTHHETLKIQGLPDSKDFVLTVLSDPGISSKRDSLITELRAAGFEDLKAVTKSGGKELPKMGTQKTLEDWPMIKALGG